MQTCQNWGTVTIISFSFFFLKHIISFSFVDHNVTCEWANVRSVQLLGRGMGNRNLWLLTVDFFSWNPHLNPTKPKRTQRSPKHNQNAALLTNAVCITSLMDGLTDPCFSSFLVDVMVDASCLSDGLFSVPCCMHACCQMVGPRRRDNSLHKNVVQALMCPVSVLCVAVLDCWEFS